MSGKSDEKKVEELADDNGRSFDGISRREWLKTGAAGFAGATALGGGALTKGVEAASTDPGDPQPSDNIVGGGTLYDNKVSGSSPEYTVTSASELDSALSDAGSGDLIWIPDGTTIDISSWYKTKIPNGVTLASNRGQNGSRGGKLLIENKDGQYPYGGNGRLTAGRKVRISGIQFEGPSTKHQPASGEDYAAVAVFVNGPGVEIDNCEFWAFTNAGVRVGHVGNDVEAVNTHIHHCSFHDNLRHSLGYGVVNGYSTSDSSVVGYHGEAGCLIEYCHFDWNRHAIAGNGTSKCNYTARYNIQSENNWLHAFDMHQPEGESGGGTIHIYNNTFRLVYQANGNGKANSINIRGMPATEGKIYKNWFYNTNRWDNGASDEGDGWDKTGDEDTAINQNTATWGVTETPDDNKWQTTEPSCDYGAPRPSCGNAGANLTYNGDAAAVDANVDSDGKASAAKFSVTNHADVHLNITDVSIDPANSSITTLTDHTYAEGKYKSELHVNADLQDTTTDVNGGLSLPGSMNLKDDGHSESSHRWAVLSSGSTATLYFYQFEDSNGAVEMSGKDVTFTVSYVLDDSAGTTGTETITVTL